MSFSASLRDSAHPFAPRTRNGIAAAVSSVKVRLEAPPPNPARNGGHPTTIYGKTGVRVSVIAQGGARMDLHPDVKSAAEYVRHVYDLGVKFFDCARSYWEGKAEETYGIGLAGVRKNVSSQPRAGRLRTPKRS